MYLSIWTKSFYEGKELFIYYNFLSIILLLLFVLLPLGRVNRVITNYVIIMIKKKNIYKRINQKWLNIDITIFDYYLLCIP